MNEGMNQNTAGNSYQQFDGGGAKLAGGNQRGEIPAQLEMLTKNLGMAGELFNSIDARLSETVARSNVPSTSADSARGPQSVQATQYGGALYQANLMLEAMTQRMKALYSRLEV